MESLFAPTFNLALLIGLLVFKLRAPLRSFVSQRHLTIRDELQRVKDQLRQAQEKYEEFTAHVKALDAESMALRDQTKKEITALQQRIMAEARRLSSTVINDAKNAVDHLFSDLRDQLYIEYGTKVLDRTEILLREKLTSEDRSRIRQEFLSQMEKAS